MIPHSPDAWGEKKKKKINNDTQVTSNPGHHTKGGKDEKTDEETLREKIP